MNEMKLALYGGGKMGLAMLRGWLADGLKPENVAVFDPKPALELERLNVHVNPDNFEATLVVMAVKPQVMNDVLETLSLHKDSLVISVAAGVSIASFESHLGTDAHIIRSMPNTPAAVGAGITAICGNANVTPQEMEIAISLLRAVGEVVVLDNENDMDAVTGLSGSGPAYVFYMIEAMRAAGVAQGLSSKIAHDLALATVVGAGALAKSVKLDPSELRQNVMSPGGTTVAGLEILMDASSGLEPLMQKTIAAAAERSRELGQS